MFGRKTSTPADPGDHPVGEQRTQIRKRRFRPDVFHRAGKHGESLFDVSHQRIGAGEGEPEREVDDQKEKRQTDVFIGHHHIDPVGDFTATLAGRGNRLAAGPRQHRITAVGQKGVGVDGMFLPEMPNLRFHLVADGRKLLHPADAGVMFEQLDGKETGRDVPITRHIKRIDPGSDRGNRLIDIRAVGELRRAVLGKFRQRLRKFFQQEPHAARPAADRLDDGRTEAGLQFRDVEFHPLFLRVVAHVEGEQHRDMQFGQLRGEVETAPGNRAVDHIQYEIDSRAGQLPEHHLLFRRTGGERIDARQIDQIDFHAVQYKAARLALHRHAGVVSDMLACASERIENTSFSTVWIARQADSEHLFHRAGSSSLIRMQAASSR